MQTKIATLLAAVDDVSTHVDAWINLLTEHVNSIPADIPPSPHEDGTSDRSYAEHELRAMKRDLAALVEARNAIRVL